MPTAIPAIPPHLQAQYRSGTPPTILGAVSSTTPTHTPTPPYPYSHPSSASVAPTNGHPAAATYGGGYVYPQAYPVTSSAASVPSVPPPTTTTTPALPGALANIPADQKALILRVLTMTPEQINALPPVERATYIQIVCVIFSFGLIIYLLEFIDSTYFSERHWASLLVETNCQYFFLRIAT